MPKMKTHKGAAKRFGVTGSGKVVRVKAWKGHHLDIKSSSRTRRYAGKVVVYNIWAEWCGPCVEEMPSLVNLQKAFVGKDVVVIPVAFGFGKGVTLETTAAKFKELTGGELPFFYDGELEVNGQAQTGALPATIIYDKSGKEAARLIYPAKWDAPDAVALVQAVLDGQS